MKTLEELDAELEVLKTRNLDEMQVETDKADLVCVDKLANGLEYEKWLAKQYIGHLQLVYQLSTQDPIPTHATLTVLTANVCLADIIKALGWKDGDSFLAVTLDMLSHFNEVVRIKTEIEAVQAATTAHVPACSAGPASSTLH